MPQSAPPDRCPGSPRIVPVPAGTILARVHSEGIEPHYFRSLPSPEATGGRFDPPEGEYGVLYASARGPAAIAEALLRQLPAVELTGPRYLPAVELARRKLSLIQVLRKLPLVALHGAHLAQLGQDLWLSKCGPQEYAETRLWAEAIRDWAPKAAGFEWRSRMDEDALVYVFFSDWVPEGSLAPARLSVPLDEGEGLQIVRKELLRHNVVLSL
ncbi:MAG: RES domain-containing protein [Actinobacteria bacterium]|nr:MAG: RES domain-containing protein [Actinomycetota bacterium]